MKQITYIILTLLCSAAFAQKNAESVTITYQSSFNGNRDTTSSTIVDISKNSAKIYSVGESYPGSPDVVTYIDFVDSSVYQCATLDNGQIVSSTYKFKFDNWEYTDETETVAGVKCKKAYTTINSNRIDIYYTSDIKFWGTPAPRFGITKGLVLKYVINASRVLEAVNIEYSKKSKELLPSTYGKIVESHVLQKMLNENSTKVVDIFNNQRICFDTGIKSPTSYSEIGGDSVYRFANGTIVLRKVQLPDSAWNYDIFAELSQYSDGDAYDRTGTVFVIPTDKELSYLDGLLKGVEVLPSFETKTGKRQYGKVSTEKYNVPVELIRFYTSFGTRAYNKYKYGDYNWYDSIVFHQDVTALSKYLSHEAWIGVFIGNYDRGGHIINLKLKYHPNGSGIRREVIPLFNTLNIMEMAGQSYSDFFDTDSLVVDFKINHELVNVILSYISTGHGGWGGGDEFNRKPNSIILDGNKTVFTPWRCDCASNREKNPCSGNSPDGLTSSDYSRSGWCPGTITNPVEFNYEKLSAGSHRMIIAIPQGPREGNSFSAWNVSGNLIIEQ